MKYKNLHLRVLLILTVYLFFSITNAFFASKQTAAPRRVTSLKAAAENVLHLPKANKAAIYQTRLSVSQMVQAAAQFFIVLLLGIGLLITSKPGRFSLKYRPDLHYSYLRHCVIRI